MLDTVGVTLTGCYAKGLVSSPNGGKPVAYYPPMGTSVKQRVSRNARLLWAVLDLFRTTPFPEIRGKYGT